MNCKHCKRPLILVLGVLRAADWSTWCGIGDAKHEVEMSDERTASCFICDGKGLNGCKNCEGKMVVESTPSGEPPALVKAFAKTQRGKMRRTP